MIPEWVISTSPYAALVAVLVWLVRAIATGALVPAPQVERMLAQQQRIIDWQDDQLERLMPAADMTTRVIASLPTPEGGSTP